MLLLVMYLEMNGQSITFNKRYSLGYPAAVFCGLHISDSIYFVSGIVASPLNSNNTGALFARFDTMGNCIDSGAVYALGRNYQTWQNTLNFDENSFSISGYGSDQTMNFCMLLKYNISGDTLWLRKYIDPNAPTGFIVNSDMKPTVNGSYLLAATVTDSTILKGVPYILCLDSIGNILWDTTFPNPVLHRYYARFFKDMPDKNVITFYENNIQNQSTAGNYQARHIYTELDDLGNVLWTRSPLPSNLLVGMPNELIKTKDGGYLMGTSYGVRKQYNPNYYGLEFDGYVYKLDSSWNFLWGRRLMGVATSDHSAIRKVYEQEDSSIIAIGTIPYYAPNDTFGFWYGAVFKLSAQGDSIWGRKYYITELIGNRNKVYDAKRTPDGGFLICGESTGYMAGQPQQQGWLLKLDSMGCLIPGCNLTAVENIAGQEEKIDIKVYPNPVQAGEYLNFYIGALDSDSRPNLSAMIYDIYGKLLQNHSLPSDDATYMLPTEGMSPGTYILHVLDERGRILGVKQVVIR